MVQLAGFVYDSAGVALSTGITVNIYARNTVTPVVVSPTVNASGYWQATGVAEGRYDVEIVNGTTTRRIKYDDELQVQRVETAVLQVRNPANTFIYDIVPGAITANRTLNLPVITATDTLAVLSLAQTFSTGVKTFNSSILAIRNPADTFSYTVVASAITAARNLTIPLITADDTLAVLGLAQTFSSGVKTFNSSILALRNPGDTFSYTVVASAITAARNLTVPLITADDTLAVLGLAQTFSATQTFSAATAAAFGSNTVTGAFTASGSTVTFSGGTASTSTSTGTIVISGSGGLGVGGAAYIGTGMTVSSDPNSAYAVSITQTRTGDVTNGAVSAYSTGSSTTTHGAGSFLVGVAAETRVNAANTVAWTDTAGLRGFTTTLSTQASSTGTITGAAHYYVKNMTVSGSPVTNQYGVYAEALSGATNNYLLYGAGAGRVVISDTTVSTSTTTGALVVTGGLGIGGAAYIGGVVNMQGAVGIGFTGAPTGSGANIGAASTNNSIWSATQGAASTTLYIGNASINVTSDARVKSHIVPFDADALALIDQLEAVEYDQHEHRPFGNVEHYVGLTAQNVYKVAPWVVNTQGGADCPACLNARPCNKHLPWQVKHELLAGLFVKAIQQLRRAA